MGILNTQLTASTVLAANANIPVGNVVHKSSCALSASGNTWKIEGAGYYKVTANVTISPTAAADMVVTLSENGTAIAVASATPSAAGANVNCTLIGVIYNKCACAEDALTLTIDSAGTVLESDVIIERM